MKTRIHSTSRVH